MGAAVFSFRERSGHAPYLKDLIMRSYERFSEDGRNSIYHFTIGVVAYGCGYRPKLALPAYLPERERFSRLLDALIEQKSGLTIVLEECEVMKKKYSQPDGLDARKGTGKEDNVLQAMPYMRRLSGSGRTVRLQEPGSGKAGSSKETRKGTS